jgi:hypothetical protein
MSKSPRRRLRLLVTVASSLILAGTALSSADLRPTPPFTGPALPEPPQQKQPWSPPETGLPKFLVTATATLAEQGLADPRSCEYREVEFVGQDKQFFMESEPRAMHAWVLPAKPEGGPRFAIAWNGLVYPLVKLGDLVDLAADIPSLPEAADKSKQAGPVGRGYQFFRATSHLQSASQSGREPIRACLLLRLGRPDLAERAFAASTGWIPPGSPRDLTSYGVSYSTLATDWTCAMFERAAAAHARHDDTQALADARELSRIKPLIEARARAMGFPEQPQNSLPGYLPFLKPLPTLLADQEGRALRQGGQVRKVAEIEKIADQNERIAALIDVLDEYQGFGRSTFQNPAGSSAVQALTAEGMAAVVPLIKVVESDDRLTRETEGDDRWGSRVRRFTPVYQLAMSALGTILGTNQFSSNPVVRSETDPNWRRDYAASVRAYVERFRNLTQEEKWYQIVADDRASPSQWVEVAGRIVARTVPVNSGYRRENLAYRQPKVDYCEKVARLGDPLRGKKSPSVAELIARRVETLSRPDGEFQGMFWAKGLALDLALWDPNAAKPVMADVARRCLDRISGKIPERFSQQKASEAAILSQLVDARAQLGDPNGLADYAEMLSLINPGAFSHSIESILQPMEEYFDQPAIVKVTEKLFLDPASPWLPFLGDDKHPNAWNERASLLNSPMLGVASFRRMLINTLGDHSPFGSSRLAENGSLSYRVRNGGSGGSSSGFIDPDGPKSTPDVPMRSCDYLAWKLSEVVVGIPSLMPYWPEERRDRVIAEQVAFLERFGARYAASPLRETIPINYNVFNRRVPTFPHLDDPATLDEARQGLAIFSLEGQGPTRVVNLAGRPLEAAWVTLKDYPRQQQSFSSATGKTTNETVYDQAGLVWQAEEVQEGDRWRRYYGFAGRRIDRVPAEEIEFRDSFNRPSLMSDKIDALLVQDRDRPRTFVLRLRNRSGLPRTIPTSFATADPPSLRPGVDLTLSFTAVNYDQFMGQRFGRQEFKWEDLKPKSTARFNPDLLTRTLEAAESFDAFSIRLEDWFDIERQGTYNLRIRFGAESGIGEGTSNESYFPIPEITRPER